MSGQSGWRELRDRRMAEPGAVEEYVAARIAYELGKSVRQMREARAWSQSDLAREAGMTQSAVARFEAGGTIPTLPVVERLAHALGADVDVRLIPRAPAA
ncbi:helix-turn-helix transcriptional regulator [Sphaerisporangium sp. NPDC051017]|uniref:helix-turn-helix domain-containing protein n=1 Tax=Sphaerisporangium sp. NPDC051017 TaxID=3154636 RepID=UPI00343505D6